MTTGVASPMTFPIMLTSDEAKILKHVSEADHIPEDVLIKKFVLDGLAEYRIDFACRAYARGRLNLSGAARVAGIGVEEMMNHLDRRGIEWRPTREQFLDGLEALAESFDNETLRRVVQEERARQPESSTNTKPTSPRLSTPTSR